MWFQTRLLLRDWVSWVVSKLGSHQPISKQCLLATCSCNLMGLSSPLVVTEFLDPHCLFYFHTRCIQEHHNCPGGQEATNAQCTEFRGMREKLHLKLTLGSLAPFHGCPQGLRSILMGVQQFFLSLRLIEVGTHVIFRLIVFCCLMCEQWTTKTLPRPPAMWQDQVHSLHLRNPGTTPPLSRKQPDKYDAHFPISIEMEWDKLTVGILKEK